ncbi:SAM-dependent methyltransferase [Actibacterium sp. XHP0104]|uniref:SAM-dependent methyltransferase n=1 Tax=Actibacterium sp. XHP0104 TaxID=2984335 RepID=UPI0021E8FF25|nr:class I SAM-dependent methyltransferase [Actibacterium sp. XHP0104]MCV2881272.1 class I SAM-dependent methyltransferase [Actibacterium sp. XHP0104]
MWNERFSTKDYVFGTEPAAFLKRAAPLLAPGQSALAVADGEGRNSVWLAEQGLEVTAFDFAPNGLDKGRALAKARGVTVDFRQSDIFKWDWAGTQYDVVAAIFIQFMGPGPREQVFQGLKQALKPGGLLLLHGYAPRQVGYGTGGPGVEENMYTTDLLRQAFDGFEILRLDDYDAEIDEGHGHKGLSGLVDLIARKP